MENEELGCSGSCGTCGGCGDNFEKDDFSPIITLTDDDGVDSQFEVLDVVVLEDWKEFLVVADPEDVKNGDVEVVILQINEEDGDEVYDTVTDQELAQKVFEEFMNQQEDENE